jgi:drug/metabolite transporter (DMT)-like permease
MRAGSRAQGGQGAGWGLALLSSACFSTSGSFGTPLIHAGWSPGAAITIRVGVAGVLLAVPAALTLRGQWGLLRRNLGLIAGYGLVAIAGCQLFYFNALATLTVGVALLLEYLGMVMVVAWLWIRHHQRPRRLTLCGTGLSIAGLVLVLDVFGDAVRIDLVGVLWALAAAVGLAAYFVLSSHASGGLPPLALASSGLLVAAAALLLVGLVGIMPLHASSVDVALAGHELPWWVPIIGLSIVAATVAYAAGVNGMRILGPKLGSFVSLAEVLFAVLFAWILLGQLPALVQLTGGALIVGGVALVRADEARGPTHGGTGGARAGALAAEGHEMATAAVEGQAAVGGQSVTRDQAVTEVPAGSTSSSATPANNS